MSTDLLAPCCMPVAASKNKGAAVSGRGDRVAHGATGGTRDNVHCEPARDSPDCTRWAEAPTTMCSEQLRHSIWPRRPAGLCGAYVEPMDSRHKSAKLRANV